VCRRKEVERDMWAEHILWEWGLEESWEVILEDAEGWDFQVSLIWCFGELAGEKERRSCTFTQLDFPFVGRLFRIAVE